MARERKGSVPAGGNDIEGGYEDLNIAQTYFTCQLSSDASIIHHSLALSLLAQNPQFSHILRSSSLGTAFMD